ncbi:SubName: Full=Uncharacterized protein {ECO:0000313/EMBL:CCA75372.1} [Serendipita indica DSM 11827]|uniref:Uncharacterized protein n=1 Tax=Serendipita indica (strain DSM 11827) TaxID=1109443 RepID=G4TVM9_SERID|nr:SubName: Full=Uncharacterized protein {ECO:0000313/EMBL:CCA75372.1} [Serendipita indica DSM 11827]CCA75372.1 hypothetical protein PIIN_09356 [Serendipita indica DSM 11827]
MPSDRDTLLSFGFDPARIDWALKATAGRGLQPAMDHILENEGKPIPETVTSTGEDAKGNNDEDEDMKLALSMSQEGQEAKSIKCTECGKVFRNTAMAEFHAEKSGHDQFEESTDEIKPLTEEEKKQKLAELRQKMAEKRAKKNEAEAEERKANEALRRKAGKDAGQIRQELQLKEANKEAEQRKKEKLDDAKARAAVKAQIEADKKARAEKAAKEKALREGQALPVASTSTASSQPAAAPGAKKEYPETRLQLRLSTGGAPLTVTLRSEQTLQDVAEYVASQSLSFDVETVNFATTFPRKVYTRADWSKTLKELGLTPSAVLMVS